MKRILIIVDPQNDFLEGGALPVAGATTALDKLCDYLKGNSGLYDNIIVTKDWHPKNHCSFVESGGTWPIHCVQNTDGADIYEPLKKLLLHSTEELASKVSVGYKGIHADTEEYSIFAEGNTAGQHIKSVIENAMSEDENTYVFFGGVAGDVCVMNTMKDCMKFVPTDNMLVFMNFQASIDGTNETLRKFCRQYKIVMG